MTKGRTPTLACGPFLLGLLLTGCGETTTPTAEQRDQLDNAAEMLDSAANELNDIDENSLAEPERNSSEDVR